MQRSAVDRVDLDARDEDRPRLLAVDREVDQGVGADAPAEQLELVRVDRDVGGVLAVAEHDGRQAAGVAQVADLLAGDVAMLGGQRRAGGGGGHGSGPLVVDRVDGAGCGSPAGRQGRGARMCAVPYHERPRTAIERGDP